MMYREVIHMKKDIVLTLDRREGDIAVCTDDGENIYEFPALALSEVSEGDRFKADINDCGEITIVDLMKQQNADARRARSERRRKLFKN